MTHYVDLYYKRNRGWPWPEKSWGLTPMYGEDGWCHSCGVPQRPQRGSLVLQGKPGRWDGAWVPNWQFDVICLEESLASKVSREFDVELKVVQWHGTQRAEVFQLLIPTIGTRWFDPEILTALAQKRHGAAGKRCTECDVWRWFPLEFPELPFPELGYPEPENPILASPEWFGSGRLAFRQIVVRRDLAELLASASPRDFKIEPIPASEDRDPGVGQ